MHTSSNAFSEIQEVLIVMISLDFPSQYKIWLDVKPENEIAYKVL